MAYLQRIITQLGPNVQIPTPMTLVAQMQHSKSSQLLLAGLQQENQPKWSINEEFDILQVLQQTQELPVNLLVLSPGHLPNWDLVSDVVSSMSPNFRSPRFCRHHFESVVIPREDGKTANTEPPPKKKKQPKGQPPLPATPGPSAAGAPVAPSPPKGRPVKTSFLYKQDEHHQFSTLSNLRFETIRSIATNRAPTMKPSFHAGAVGKINAKHVALLKDQHINYDGPLTAMQIAQNRSERLVREKQQQQAKQQAEQLARQKQQQQQLLLKQQQLKAQQQQQQVSSAQPQFQQALQARVQTQFSQQNVNAPAMVMQQRQTTPTPAPAMSTAASTASQEVANLAKALSQAAADFTTQNASAQLASNQSAMHAVSATRVPVSATSISLPGMQEIRGAQMIAHGGAPAGTIYSVSTMPATQQKSLVSTMKPGGAQLMPGTQQVTAAQFQAIKQSREGRPLTPAQRQFVQAHHQQQQLILQQQQQQQSQSVQLQSQGRPVVFVTSSAPQGGIQTAQQGAQSLVAATVKPVTAASVVSSTLPMTVPGTNQRIITTTRGPAGDVSSFTQQIIRAQPTKLIQTQGQQPKAITLQTGQAQLMQALQAIQSQGQGTSQAIFQNPVTLVKTVPAPTTMTSVAQTVSIPVSAMSGVTSVNILPSHITKVTTTGPLGTNIQLKHVPNQKRPLSQGLPTPAQLITGSMSSSQPQATNQATVTSSQPMQVVQIQGGQLGQATSAQLQQSGQKIATIQQIQGSTKGGTIQFLHQGTTAQAKLQLQQLLKTGNIQVHQIVS